MRSKNPAVIVCFIVALLSQPCALLEATFYGESPRTGLNQQPFKRGSYYVYIPASYNQEQLYPLIVLSYIYLGEPEIEPQTLMKSWIPFADQRNYIVVLPIAGGDFRFADAWYKEFLEMIKSTYAINEARILLTGFGAGAHFAVHFGATYPEWFRAVAPVAGTLEGYWKELTRFRNRNRPDFYFMVGAEDARVTPDQVKTFAQQMTKDGYVVRFETLEGVGHTYSNEFTQKIADWFDPLN